ncbi:hypothetical protein [Fructilactobacillus lindneri]|uniref:hypothetical protein n=1 Tax=Fructilactobacillus lindneri TaxID=53444 RepID=UPI0015E17134|nr:hypothetical protein [Fructilactobacillus lindneri]
MNGDKTKKSSKSVDLDDLSTVMTFQGEPIPEKYKEIVRDLLRNLKDKEENEK